jgi:photosystem II stability/assembly factor-like uncharacterized protein
MRWRAMLLLTMVTMCQLCLKSQSIRRPLNSGHLDVGIGFSTEPRKPSMEGLQLQMVDVTTNQVSEQISTQNIQDKPRQAISDSIQLLSIVCTSPSTMIASGDGGVILYSSDAGASWIQAQTATVKTIHKMSFLNVSTGVAVGDNGLILTSYNGGLNWHIQPTEIVTDLFGVSFVDQNRIYAVGRRGTVLRSNDAGQTWENLNSGAFFTLRSIKNLGLTSAIAVGVEGTIVRTSDGGNSWRHSFSGTSNDLSDASFANPELGIAVGNGGAIVRTTDGGISWSPIQHPFRVDFIGVAFADANVAVAVASNGSIVRTTNGGMEWELVRDSSMAPLFGISFPHPLSGIIVGSNGLVLYTIDSGVRWSTREQNNVLVTEKPKDEKVQAAEAGKTTIEAPRASTSPPSEIRETPQVGTQRKIGRMQSTQWKPFDASTVLLQIPGAFGGGIVIGGAGALLGAAIDPAHGGVSAGALILGTAGVFFGIPTGVYLVGNWEGGNGGYNSTLLSGPGMFLGGLLLYAASPPFGIFIMSISPIIGPILGYHLSASSVSQENNSGLLRMNKNSLTGIPNPATMTDLRINVVTINF